MVVGCFRSGSASENGKGGSRTEVEERKEDQKSTKEHAQLGSDGTLGNIG
jgi:hypothetical protein